MENSLQNNIKNLEYIISFFTDEDKDIVKNIINKYVDAFNIKPYQDHQLNYSAKELSWTIGGIRKKLKNNFKGGSYYLYDKIENINSEIPKWIIHSLFKLNRELKETNITYKKCLINIQKEILHGEILKIFLNKYPNSTKFIK